MQPTPSQNVNNLAFLQTLDIEKKICATKRIQSLTENHIRDLSAVSLLENREQRYITVINNNHHHHRTRRAELRWVYTVRHDL